ncbi:Transcription factor bye1 [Cytospora mali]|uniref:Transcription factor BYE1 n=1 Tax=Cytospora mali TaxID=578113 RepID=A0A194WAU3_CYTMA|nr:Transcription factor bye1 [Valsa mali]
MSGEPEPRRSVRSTKGQHKALEALDQPIEPKRRGSKKSNKKLAEPEPEEEEFIRCVCGATSQEGYAEDEPWIGCENCGAWQHNVCVGMSIFGEDLEDVTYYCEQCKPEDHKKLVAEIERGEKPWVERRRKYEEDKAEEDEKKKKKGFKRGKKRLSEIPQDEPRSSQKSAKSSASPAPEKKIGGAKNLASKRKDRHDSADTTTREPSKLRKVSDSEAVPVPADYEPPSDLPISIPELPSGRQGSAKLLQKALAHVINAYEKEGGYNPADGTSNESRAERLALAIERAVHDTHPNVQEYAKQCRTLGANLKTNSELIVRLLDHTLTPPMLAVMTSDDLASEKQQQETAAARERSMRQSIISTEDGQNGPRYRRTHKGDELIDGDNVAAPNEASSFPQRQLSRDVPTQPPKAGGPARVASQGPASHSRKPSGEPMRIDTQQSPTTDFDINKVFSSVKSPTTSQRRRPSAPAPPPSQGPGVDPEVDRLLEDDGDDSPPYSPTEETDPDVVWRGNITMTSIADCHATAKHIGGANLAKTLGISWETLVPRQLTISGRLAVSTANEYLCGMRWSPMVDIVVASLMPASENGKADFDRIFNYFMSKEKYAVVGDKGLGNVKDTYLIPVAAGTGNHPEFLLNLEDNSLPQTRTENMLLLVIVYRNDNATMNRIHGNDWNSRLVSPPTHNSATPTPVPATFAQRSTSISAPTFSPTTPHLGSGGFPTPQPDPNAQGQPGPYAQHHPQQHPNQAGAVPMMPQPQHAPGRQLSQHELQQQGEARAREILGPYYNSPTAAFLMPQAAAMQPNEWHIVRGIFDREPLARENLQVLSELIAKAGQAKQAQAQQSPPQQHQHQQHPPPPPANHSAPVGPPSASPKPPQAPLNTVQQPTPQHAMGQQPLVQHSPPPAQTRQTPISLPSIPGMPASVHQSYQAAQAQAHQARNVHTPAAPPA